MVKFYLKMEEKQLKLGMTALTFMTSQAVPVFCMASVYLQVLAIFFSYNFNAANKKARAVEKKLSSNFCVYCY